MAKTRKDETETVRRKLSKLGYEQNWRELTTLVTTLRRENRIKDSIQAPDGDGKTCLWGCSLNITIAILPYRTNIILDKYQVASKKMNNALYTIQLLV